MPIIAAPHELADPDIYLDLNPVVHREIYLKCEGLNFGGSVKMRAAAAMINAAKRAAQIDQDSVLIESSSGNLGVAISVIASSMGLGFTCVTDRNCNETTFKMMRALGTEVIVVEEQDPDGGYLQARIDTVQKLCASDDRYVWLNQYTNEANWSVHYASTAPSILNQFPQLDVLFVGVGTGGTAMGCVRYFRDSGTSARVIAIDAVGSVSFGGPKSQRLVPGLGAAVQPPLLDRRVFDDVVHVPELDTIRICRFLAAKGMLFGGSTGTVVSGALCWLSKHDPERNMRCVCISADMGERYLDTVYNDSWVESHFGDQSVRQR
jgi:2,3-diaminopropionate biosynthesis protein SbnA